MKEDISKLLILQSEDIKLETLKQKSSKLNSLILDLKENLIKEKDNLKSFENSIKEKLSKRASLSSDRKSLEEKVIKYKIQLATLKKNDEYQAMQNTIDRTNSEISNIEEKELELLYDIDNLEKELIIKREETQNNLSEIEKNIQNTQKDLDSNEEDFKKVTLNRDKSKENISENFYKAYERLLASGRKLPIVSIVEDSKCTGCHLKISVSLESSSNENSKNPVLCEHCGRILYT